MKIRTMATVILLAVLSCVDKNFPTFSFADNVEFPSVESLVITAGVGVFDEYIKLNLLKSRLHVESQLGLWIDHPSENTFIYMKDDAVYEIEYLVDDRGSELVRSIKVECPRVCCLTREEPARYTVCYGSTKDDVKKYFGEPTRTSPLTFFYDSIGMTVYFDPVLLRVNSIGIWYKTNMMYRTTIFSSFSIDTIDNDDDTYAERLDIRLGAKPYWSADTVKAIFIGKTNSGDICDTLLKTSPFYGANTSIRQLFQIPFTKGPIDTFNITVRIIDKLGIRFADTLIGQFKVEAYISN